MADKWRCNFGFRSTTAGHEYDSNVGAGQSIDTTTTRTGGQSLKITGAGGTQIYIRRQFRGTGDSTKTFYCVYYNFPSLPASDGTILGLTDAADADQGGGLKLKTDGTVILIGGSGTGFAQVGSPSAALATNTWHRLEISFDDSNVNNTITGWANGTQFATGNGQDMAGNASCLVVGDIDAVGLTMYIADIGINDTSGTFQTGQIGDHKVLYYSPTVAGDVNTFATQTGGTAGAANNYTRVNQTVPDDATTFNGSSTLNEEDLMGIGALGLNSYDTINVVEVHGRFRNSTADPTAKITFEIEKTGSGTKTSSSAITPNSTTWRSNVAGTTLPKTAPIVAYQDPDAGTWSPTSSTIQIGYKLTTGPGTAGRRIDVTKIVAIVDYTPGTPPASGNSSFFALF